MVDFCSLTDCPGLILSLDQEKAFHRVDWSFLRSTLSAMGFGLSVCHWVDLFYRNVCSAVNVNGYLSCFFCLSRGVRQGCPLSPLLYVLVFLGPVDLAETNWRPRITAVANVLNSWRKQILSYSGRALVVNALALSRVWYVAALIHVPHWVVTELSSLVFKFFWGSKQDLVARKVVVQPPCLGGFSMVDVQSKVYALHIQWVRTFLCSPSSWVSFMSFWFSSCFAASPHVVFSSLSRFSSTSLPPFYAALLDTWCACRGSFSPRIGFGSGIDFQPVSSLTTKSAYLYLLSELASPPHCVAKFLPSFCCLYLPATWCELRFFPLDRPVIELSWKVAHGVLYTGERLISFGYDVPSACFCGHLVESLEHLFFSCPLASSVFSWVQSLMFHVSPVLPSILPRHVLFGFSDDELRAIPRFFVYLINVCKFIIWVSRNDFRFCSVQPAFIDVVESVKSRLRFFLPLYFRHFHSARHRQLFVRQWGAHGVYVSLVGDKLTVLL